jgi:nicotinamide mononucleotide (NMN) deamidase PncC
LEGSGILLSMEGVTDQLIEGIQSSGFKAALVVSGGATGAAHALLSHPGASRFVFEVQVPYSPEAMFDYLGEKLNQACSPEAAATLAGRAFERALIFSLSSKESLPILGIACTCALQTNRDRRGEDRAFFCIKSRKKEVTRKLDVFPGSRAMQEATVSEAFLNFISEFIEEGHA